MSTERREVKVPNELDKTGAFVTLEEARKRHNFTKLHEDLMANFDEKLANIQAGIDYLKKILGGK